MTPYFLKKRVSGFFFYFNFDPLIFNFLQTTKLFIYFFVKLSTVLISRCFIKSKITIERQIKIHYRPQILINS
jgi:hypothetical protein